MRFSGIFDEEATEKLFIRDDLRQAMAESGEYRAYYAKAPGVALDLEAILRESDVALTAWFTPMLPVSILRDRPRRLKYVCNVTGTVRMWIPREYIEAGVIVTNWGDGPMWYLAEGNLALMLACTREMPRLRKHMLEQPQWVYPYASPAPTLRRKTVGFVGMGAIGRLLVGLLAPFECKIIAFDPYAQTLPEGVRRCETLEQLFEQSDVVTVQCGLTDETTGLIGRALFDRLRPHAIFVNTARGKIVREKEMVEFLQARKDVFAALDVYEKEPVPRDSPLLQMDNVICYPHSVGAGGDEMYRGCSEYAARNIRAFAAGRPLTAIITPEIYDRMT